MHPDQAQLVALLKSKGTGATMGKSLDTLALSQLRKLFVSPSASLTTKATLLTAILLLEPTPEEDQWIQTMKASPLEYLPTQLHVFFQPTNDHFTRLIQHLISKKDLTQTECKFGIAKVLDPSTPDYLKAAFLESLRLKRETPLENAVFFDELLLRTSPIQIAAPFLIDLSNAYDGFNRNLYLTPFLAALLASVGVPCVMHGIDEVSPKKGVNPFKLLQTANKNPLHSQNEVKASLENPEIGWGYCDQRFFAPFLARLKPLRVEMVKRPFLATLEKLLCPFYAEKTVMITSFTHPPYRKTMSDLLNQHPFLNASILLRGVEGSIQLGMDRRTPCLFLPKETTQEAYVHPRDFGLKEQEYSPPSPDWLAQSVREGIDALQNNEGYAKDCLIYNGSMIFTKLGLLSPKEAKTLLELSIKTGKAWAHWNAGCL